MIGALVGLTVPAAAVWLLIESCGGARVVQSRLARAAVALGAGVGLSALTTYWFVAIGTDLASGFVIADALLWFVIGMAARSRRRPASSPAPESHRLTPVDWAIRGAFAMIAALAFATVIRGYFSLPHGDWDAWAIWNQKARFLFRGGEQWTDVLTIEWSQPAHPLLLPLSVARMWAYAGSELPIVPALLGIAFGISIVAAVVGGLGADRKRAWVAGAILLAPSAFITQWTAQQADIPFAFFMVSSLILLGHAARASWRGTEDARGPVVLAGVLVGLAAWTKNEGILLICATTVLVVAMGARTRRVSYIGWWAAGLAPALLTVAWFKLVVAPVLPFYLPEEPLIVALTQRLSEPEHRPVIDAALWHGWTTWGGPGAAGAAALITVAALSLAFTRAGRVARELVVVPFVMFGGYYAVYLLTSLDVAWLIATTFNRLLTQLWPSLVLATFFVAARADERGGPQPSVAPRATRSPRPL